MSVRGFLIPAIALLIAACAVPGQTQVQPMPVTGAGIPMQEWAGICDRWDKWDKPAPPYRIHGNSYYVGTCGIAAILIAEKDQLILIDTGTEKGADVVVSNLRTLGVDLMDVDFLTHSHEHHDHIGGAAKVLALTDAILVGNFASVPVIETGKVTDSDPQFGVHPPMAPIDFSNRMDGWRKIENGESIYIDGFRLIAHETPGHSPGAMSWQWESCDDQGDCKTIVYAGSLSPVSAEGYKFSDRQYYVNLFRQSIARIAALKCDILITPHPSHSNMVRRAATGTFEGGMSCKEYAAGKMRDLDKRLAEEAAEENGAQE